ncbi:MAG: DJ-1/PfpI family protein [Sneathiellales bacterium]|nr:DJ-1/PfpI family protein [Sneathiellales bacterium]
MNKRRKLLFYLFDGTLMLDIAGPLQVFHSSRGYDVEFVSASGGTVTTDVGVMFETKAAEAFLEQSVDLLLISGGGAVFRHYQEPSEIQAINILSKSASRIASICTGAFLLAAAKLLDHKSCVTHWRYCDRLREEFPKLNILQNRIYVQDGRLWTSAGVTAGIDLALAMVEADFGRTLSLQIAQELVVFARRPGGQNQFSSALKNQFQDPDGKYDELHSWVKDNLPEGITVLKMAQKLGMSERNFIRLYKMDNGINPGEALRRFKFKAAEHLLLQTGHPLKQVAHLSGFGHYENLRRAFATKRGVTPQAFRERFQQQDIIR